jgi:superfamily II DNA or RNA helicase
MRVPSLVLEEKCAAGRIRQLLRLEAEVTIVDRTEAFISPKIKRPVFLLENGERLLVTDRSGTQRQADVDGVLLDTPDGLKWVTHRALEAARVDDAAIAWRRLAHAARDSWQDQVSFRSERIGATGDAHVGLRPPQLGALHAIGSHWAIDASPATIVMPTGTGKTETMVASLVAYNTGPGPVLVIVPWDLLRGQTARKYVTLGLLRQLKVVPESVSNPVVGVIERSIKRVEDLAPLGNCNVLVATASAIGARTELELIHELARGCSALVIDEAHHVAAASWARLREAFRGKPIIQFTATPFRRDGRLVDGKVIFNYSLAAAQRGGYFKPISFAPIYELSPGNADRSIAKQAIAKLRTDIAADLDHILMARCKTIARAKEVIAIYRGLAPDLNPEVISSDDGDVYSKVQALRNGDIRIVVCVDMLGEGFDLPQLKIAAIHDSHKSLAVTLQFIGRFTRVAHERIGEATAIANIADASVSVALERLYSEDADWNLLLSELSSNASREHAELIRFLDDSRRMDQDDDDEAISNKTLNPVQSTLMYRATSFDPEQFHKGLPASLKVQSVWVNRTSNTLYFTARTDLRVRWIRSGKIRDREWSLFIVHFNEELKTLFVSSTDHSQLFGELAAAVSGEVKIVNGDAIFRSLAGINRLIFQNVGVRKHGRRNLSFASYTGADVAEALGLAEKAGSVKNNLSGMGWEEGRRVAVGCSYKGLIWTREQSSIPKFIEWCAHVGRKVNDDTIDTRHIMDNVLIPTEVIRLPEGQVLGVEWPVEILRQPEERVNVFEAIEAGDKWPVYALELQYLGTADSVVTFAMVADDSDSIGVFTLRVGGERGFEVVQHEGKPLNITIGSKTRIVSEYLSDYPPLVRYVDLRELDGNLLIGPQHPQSLRIDQSQFDAWDWATVDITKESIRKDGDVRRDSVQWASAQYFIDAGFEVVFDDDGAGEAADLVCLKEEDQAIRLALVHCKYSGGATAGGRVKDAVEVSSQAVRSAKWKWKFEDLGKHLIARQDRVAFEGDNSRYLQGTPTRMQSIVRAHRLKPVLPEIYIVQPGLLIDARTADQEMVLAAASAYLKQTIGCTLKIIGSRSRSD